MTKKSRKRSARFEKQQSGCMWSLINIFDFRHGTPSQRLLLDRKHVKKRTAGAGYPDVLLESLGDSCEVCKEPNAAVESETPTINSSKTCVNLLMEEDQKNRASTAIIDTKWTRKDDEEHAKKSHGRTRSKIDLDPDDFVAAEELSDRHTQIKNSAGSVDLNVMVEEICSHFHQKDVSHYDEPATQTIKDPSVVEEKLCEATKVLVDHFTDGKSFNKDGKIQSSRELVGALQALNSNKDVFLKLLKDPNSLLAKYIQNLQDIQIEEGKQNSGNGKHQSFFWRRFKGLERNSSRKSDSSEELNRIVVLKPSPLHPLSSDIGVKGQIERVSSSFSFTQLKRKLRHAMRKEPVMINRDMKTGGEFPSRDRLFIERITRLSPGLKKDEKIQLECETVLSPKRSVSNFYVEAKKHLAEIVGSSDANFYTQGKTQVPKALGRILSYSGYSSPTICSPRTDPHLSVELPCESRADKSTHEAEICASEVDADIVRSSDAESPKVSNLTEVSSKCSATTVGQEICNESRTSSFSIESTPTCSVSEKIKDVDITSDATSKPSPVSVLDPVFNRQDEINQPSAKSFTVVESFQPRQIQFEAETSSSPEQFSYNRNKTENNKYTVEFVKAVVLMSALTWDELLRRSLFSEHLIEPELIDEVDFLPDFLPCDFNLLFVLISEVLIEIFRVNFGCTLSFAKPFVKPEAKGKDIFTEIWKRVDWYLNLDVGPQLTLEKILGNDFANPETWMDIELDREGIGIQVQEAILQELVEELMQEEEFPDLPPADESEDSQVSVNKTDSLMSKLGSEGKMTYRK